MKTNLIMVLLVVTFSVLSSFGNSAIAAPSSNKGKLVCGKLDVTIEGVAETINAVCDLAKPFQLSGNFAAYCCFGK